MRPCRCAHATSVTGRWGGRTRHSASVGTSTAFWAHLHRIFTVRGACMCTCCTAHEPGWKETQCESDFLARFRQAGAIRGSQIIPGVILKECSCTYDPTPATQIEAPPHTGAFRSTCDSLRTWQSTLSLTRHPAQNLGESKQRDHPRLLQHFQNRRRMDLRTIYLLIACDQSRASFSFHVNPRAQA